MAHFILTDLFFQHDSTDLSDHIIGMNLEYDADEVEDTAAGDITHIFLAGGLFNYKLTVELAQDLGASEVDATLFADVGTAKTITVRNNKTDGVGATNPNYTATMILQSYSPIGAKIGEKAITTAVYIAGGTLSRAEA